MKYFLHRVRAILHPADVTWRLLLTLLALRSNSSTGRPGNIRLIAVVEAWTLCTSTSAARDVCFTPYMLLCRIDVNIFAIKTSMVYICDSLAAKKVDGDGVDV